MKLLLLNNWHETSAEMASNKYDTLPRVNNEHLNFTLKFVTSDRLMIRRRKSPFIAEHLSTNSGKINGRVAKSYFCNGRTPPKLIETSKSGGGMVARQPRIRKHIA